MADDDETFRERAALLDRLCHDPSLIKTMSDDELDGALSLLGIKARDLRGFLDKIAETVEPRQH